MKDESNGLFLKTSKRVALSAVVSALLVQGLSATTFDTNSSDSNSTANGLGTSWMDQTIIGAGVAQDEDVTVNSGVKLSGTVTSGLYADMDGDANNVPEYYSGNDTNGTAVGLDINSTGVGNITNNGIISATASTLASYTDGAGVTHYPDQNNTVLNSAALKISNAITGKLTNTGTISTSVTLSDDSNNSQAYAPAVMVEDNIGEGIVNSGTIIATATKTNTYTDSTGAVHTVTQKTIGGHTGTQNDYEGTFETGEDRPQPIDRKYAAGIYNIDEKEIRSESEAGKTQLENDFKRVSPIIYDENFSNSTVTDTIAAAGILVDDGKKITGGIEDHGYISSVLNSDGSTIVGKAGGHENGITITPGGLATTTGAEPADGTAPSEDDVNNAKQAAADKEDALAQYEDDLAAYNQAIEDYQTAHPDAVKNLLRNNDANSTQDTSPGKAKYYNDNNFSADLNATAIENWIAAPEQANLTKPTPPVNDVTKPSANTNSATPPTIVATPVVDGSKTARIGDIINEVGAKIDGAGAGHGLEIRATSGSNVASLLNDQNDTLDANLTNNAYVTSGHASAYLGEGSENRTISHDENGNVTNTLVGGLKNLGDIDGAGASSAILLNASSDISINFDDNNSDNLNIHTTTDANGNVVPITLDPSSTVAMGELLNYASGKITGKAGANGLELIATGNVLVNSNNDGNITGGKLTVKPSSVNSIAKVINAGTIAGGAGAAGIGMDAKSKAGILSANGQIDDANITITPVVTNRIDLIANIGTIKGGMGGSAIKSEAKTEAGIEAKDINNSSDLTVNAKVSSTVGDIYNTGTMSQSLGKDSVHLIADGKSGLKTDNVEGNSIVSIDSTTTGGIRVKGNANATGNLVNGGTISVSLSQHGINTSAIGKTLSEAVSGDSKDNTKVTDSDVKVKSTVIAGIEGDLSNISTSLDENRTKEVNRGTISASLSQDGALITATGETDLAMKNITNSTVSFEQNTTAGVGGNLTNGGTMSVSLSKDVLDLSSDATTLAHDKDNSEINASTVTTKTNARAGIGGSFINGAYALETGDELNATSLVDNEKDANGNYKRKLVIAAEVNENNTSDVNSSNAHTNPLLTNSDLIFYHDREAAITDPTISASLSHDGVKFTSDATGTVTPKLVTVSTLEKKDSDGNIFNTQVAKSIVDSQTVSNSRILKDFINNGTIKVSLSHRAVNSETNAIGTLGDIGSSEIIGSKLSQSTTSIGGVNGDFKNVAVSSDVGAGTAYTELSGSSDNSKEVARIIYAKANNANNPLISSSLADDAINLSAKATNEIKVKSSSASEAVTSSFGSGSTTKSYSESTIKAKAHASKAYLESTTRSKSGIGKDFVNNGTIKVSLAKNGLNAESIGNTNTIDGTGATTINGTDVNATMTSIAGVRGNFTNDVTSLDKGSATILYHDVYNSYTLDDGTVVEYSPKYYENNDTQERKRVKSNVIDSDAVVYSKDGRIDTDGFVYSKTLSKGIMSAALAKSPVKLDGEVTTTVKPASIGTSEVKFVTLHTGYASDNNSSKVDFNTTAKVVSNTTQTSTVFTGIGKKFTNKNLMSSALSADVVNVAGDATSKFGDSTTSVEGGEHTVTTTLVSGIGNDSKDEKGFLNAADTYDKDLATDKTKIRVGHAYEASTALLVDAKANDYLDENASTPLKIQDSKTIAFWNKELVVGEMKASLSKDLVKADAKATTELKPTDVTAATGVLTKDDNDSITFDVVGSYVDGTAKTKITQTTITKAGIDGNFTNQGKMTVSLSKQLLNTEATATTNLGDNGVTNVVGSELNATTIVVGGIQGNFKNEVISKNLDNGEAIVDTNAYDPDPKVVFNKTTTVGQVVMSTSLSAENINLRSNANNTVDVASSNASDAVEYSGEQNSWLLSQLKSDAIKAKSKITSSSYSIAGVRDDFYNSGKISAALSKQLSDATTTADNKLNAGADKEYLGTDINLVSSAMGGIQGSFTNDVVSIDTGAKEILYKDVLDENGNPTYYVYHGKNTDNDSTTSNDNNISAGAIAADGTRVKSNVADKVIYDQEVVEGEMTTSLSKELLKLDATATNTITPAKLGVNDVNVVRAVKPTGDSANNYDGKKFDANETITVVSGLNAQTYAIAGIGERFTNKSKMAASLSKDLVSVAGNAETNFGNSVTEITGGDINDVTVVLAGIGNDLNTTNKAGFINIANTYDETKGVDTSKINSGNNNTNHLVASNNAHDANVDENTTYLNLIDSKEVAFWDKKLIVSEMSASLSKEVIKAEAVATSTLKPKSVENATNDVNLTAKDALVALDGYKVAGQYRADVNKTTTVTAGINGGFYNQGKITSSLSKDVLNAKAEALGTLGDVGATTIKGAKVSQTTISKGGLVNGGFRNEALSFDLDSGDVYTQAAANGTQSAKARFTKTTTIGQVEMSTATSGGSDVLRLNSSATNLLDTLSIEASDAVSGNDGLATANTARANVTNQTIAYGGIEGNFYNNQKLEAKTSDNVISSTATSDNDLGTANGTVNGSVVTASAITDSTITGDFLNDAKLLDDGAVTNITYKKTTDGNDSNVVDTITYEQKIAKGEILSTTAKDALNMVATGNNDILLDTVGNKEVTVATTDANGNITHSSSDYNVSSTVTATNSAITGIEGKFTNKGDIKGSSGAHMLDFQAVGGPATVTIGKVGGGSVTAENNVTSGINLSAKNTVAFENKVTDFNTVLKTDENYDDSKVITGTIEADTGSNALNFEATGGAKNDLDVDTKVITAGQEGNRDIATVKNRSKNLAIVNGDFINEGDIIGDDKALNFVATNEAYNDVKKGNVADSGMLNSVVDTTVKAYINGSLTNSGNIKTNQTTAAINLESVGGTSTAKGSLADVNSTEYASANGITISDTTSTTEASIGAISNKGGTIEGLSGAKAIALTASGSADSSEFNLGDVSGDNSGKVLKNKLTSKASISSIYNIGEIKTADATVIDLSSTASAKTSAAGDDTKAKYEDTTATVTASIGDIENAAYTYQNKKKDVNKAFNGGVQLKPTEDVVKENGGEYDFASYHEYNSTSDIPLYDGYHFSTGTKVAKTLEFNTTEELNALAYNDNNTSDNPVLSQKIGKIVTATGDAAISVVATATDSKFTNATSSIGNVLNKGIIDGGTGKGIYLSSTGDATNGAIASATAKQIFNDVTDNNFTSQKEGLLHSIIIGEIKGDAGAIKLEAVGESDQNVSKTVVKQIVNNRVILNKGDKVITMKNNGDDIEAAITSTDDNYDITTLDKDTAYLGVIGSGKAKLAIDIGENAHVTNDILNYGKISGNVHLGDAKIHLYGLVETNASTLSNSIQMTQDELANAGDFNQSAGLVDSTEGITNSYAGSAIIFEGAHLFNGSASGHQIPAMEADEIVINDGAVVNIADDQAFDVTKATDIYNRGLKGTLTNRGILNIAAGKKAEITGKYEQLKNGSFVSHLIGSGIVDGDNEYDTAGAEFGVLYVSGDASFNSNGITLIVDGNKTDAEWTALATSGTDTILKGIVVAGSVDGNTTANTTKGSVVNVTVTDNLTTVNFKAIQGDAPGTIDLILEAAATGTPLMMGDIVQVHETIASDFTDIVSTRLDQTNGYGIDYGKVTDNRISDNGEDTDRNYVSLAQRIRSGLHNFGQRRKTDWRNFKQKIANSLKGRNYWAKPFVSHTKQDSTDNLNGYKANAYGIAIGTDKDYLNGWRTGVAFAFAKSKVDSISGPIHHDEADVFEFIGYTSKKLSKGVINLQLGYGLMKNDGSRIDDNTADVLTSKFDSTVIQAKAEYERAFKSRRLRDTTFIPYVQAFAAHIKNDGYTEGGAVSSALKVDSSSQNIFTAGAGVKVRHDLLRYRGTVVGHAGFNYDLKNDPTRTSYTPLSGADGGYVTGAKRKKLELDLGLGFQYLTTHNNRIQLGYEFKGRNGYKNHVGSIKFIVPIGKK